MKQTSQSIGCKGLSLTFPQLLLRIENRLNINESYEQTCVGPLFQHIT